MPLLTACSATMMAVERQLPSPLRSGSDSMAYLHRIVLSPAQSDTLSLCSQQASCRVQLAVSAAVSSLSAWGARSWPRFTSLQSKLCL